MKKIIPFIIVTFFVSCGEEVLYDKEVRLTFSFPFNGIEGFNSETSLLTDNIYLRNFNKKDYPKIKSITLSVFMKGPDPDSFFLELYNVTDGVIIGNSLISTSSAEYVWVDSENILSTLPNKEIDLSFSVHSGNDSGACGLIDAELILRRD